MAKAGATATPTWGAQANILPPGYGEGLQKPKCSQGLQASLRVEALTQGKGKVTLVLQSSVELLSRVQLFSTLWTVVRQGALSITKSRSLLKLMSIELVLPSNHLILSSPSSPAFSLSKNQSLFQWVSSLHPVAKVWQLHHQHQSFRWIFRDDFL